MTEFLVLCFLWAIALAIVLRVLKVVWMLLWCRVFGFKPLALDQERMGRTVKECVQEFFRAHGQQVEVFDEDEMKKATDDMQRYTVYVIERYFERAEAGL